MTDPSVGAAMDVRFGTTVEGFMEYVTALGLDHVEFKREYLAGHPDTPDPGRIAELAEEYGVSITYHAPFRNWNPGSFDDTVRRDSVARVKRTLEAAAIAGAEAVVVHGGSVPHRYPDWVRACSREQARRSLAECAEYAQYVGVPLAVENQPRHDEKRRYTTTPDELATLLDSVDVLDEYLGVTLDVGHAAVSDEDWRAFVDRFGDRIRVCHLHENDGTSDQHEPLPDHGRYLEEIPADQFVFEMKSVADVGSCVPSAEAPPEPVVRIDE
ncbi:sugar phosphate isomerase/epimerase family protein [Halorhabdus amylolytica]|uniref:sugar phosphate isomerase/epimerase family protein n=1 Tax=Halorhabdus amylolytica TaxID=2559573 RepID=UPI0010AAE88A|nr:sugar phosphate isomerase/epimerase family protein [Halorhabdus amylolytica]